MLNTANAPTPAADGGARVPLLDVADMSAEQRGLYDEVVGGPRGQMIGPLRAAIHSPDLAVRWSRLGEFLRFQTCLPKRLSELAIIVVGRHWSAQVEWWVHERVGREAGLPAAAIEAILQLEPPVFEQAADAEVYEFARLLQQTGKVPAETYAAITARWGVRGAVELTAVVGYYTMVAMTLNAHQLPVPDGSLPLPPVDGLCELPPARLQDAA